MSSFPMMSTVHHCINHRRSVEKIRVDDIAEQLKQPAQSPMPEIPTTLIKNDLNAQTSPPQKTVVELSVSTPVTTIAVLPFKPTCKPLIGVLRKDSFIHTVPFIFPNSN